MESVRIIEELRDQIDSSHSTLIGKARAILSDDEIKMIEIRIAIFDAINLPPNTTQA